MHDFMHLFDFCMENTHACICAYEYAVMQKICIQVCTYCHAFGFQHITAYKYAAILNNSTLVCNYSAGLRILFACVFKKLHTCMQLSAIVAYMYATFFFDLRGLLELFPDFRIFFLCMSAFFFGQKLKKAKGTWGAGEGIKNFGRHLILGTGNVWKTLAGRGFNLKLK